VFSWLDNIPLKCPFYSRVFLFRRHHTEIPVLLSTNLDNRAFSCPDDITLTYLFFYRLTLRTFSFSTKTSITMRSVPCMFNNYLLCFRCKWVKSVNIMFKLCVINARGTIYHRVNAKFYLTRAIQNLIMFRKKINKVVPL